MQQITQKNGIFTIEGYSKTLKTPFFFPSISSVQTNFDVYDYFALLKKTAYPAFLISAYDIYNHEKKEQLIEEVSAQSQNSSFVLMDSGHYEAYWRNDKKWSFNKLKTVLDHIDIDLCFSFDVYFDGRNTSSKHIKETIKYAAMTAGAQKSGLTVPIIHSIPKEFPTVVKKVVEGINPEIIGITERELGSSMLERAANLKKIRKELNKAKRDIPIHLLGTGNPISLLVYSLCGANLFDALEWCKTVVNPANAHLHHFVQMDLIECNCKSCQIKGLPYPARVMTHNLIFYENFMNEIRTAIAKKRTNALLKKYLPNHIINDVKKLMC